MTAGEKKKAEQDAAADGNATAQTLEASNWPLDAQGDPLVEVAFQAHELIGLPEFSNVTVGPATVRTLVSMNKPNPFTEQQLRNIASAVNQIAEVVEVDIVAHQRGIALATLDPGKRSG